MDIDSPHTVHRHSAFRSPFQHHTEASGLPSRMPHPIEEQRVPTHILYFRNISSESPSATQSTTSDNLQAAGDAPVDSTTTTARLPELQAAPAPNAPPNYVIDRREIATNLFELPMSPNRTYLMLHLIRFRPPGESEAEHGARMVRYQDFLY